MRVFFRSEIASAGFPATLTNMEPVFAVADHWTGGYEEAALQTWARALRHRLSAPRVTLGLIFVSPALAGVAAEVLDLLRIEAQIPLLIGCSSPGGIAGPHEFEDQGGLTLGLYALPGADLGACHFTEADVSVATSPADWHARTGRRPDQTHGWLIFADPFHLRGESWLLTRNRAYPGQPIVGGFARGDGAHCAPQLYLNGEVFEEGAVAVGLGGTLELAAVVSQGCTPIGEIWTITRAEQNLIHQIGNRPAYEVLVETFEQLPAEEKQKARGNLLLGFASNEYLDEFLPGDFLVRGLLAADPRSGILAVGAQPRQGQTVQFQRRDVQAATANFAQALRAARSQWSGRLVYGGCLCSCHSRGRAFFGQPDHDAGQIQAELGPLGLAGFIADGEFGPVGGCNFVHGFSAALALFIKK